jgi:hypothetical protein
MNYTARTLAVFLIASLSLVYGSTQPVAQVAALAVPQIQYGQMQIVAISDRSPPYNHHVCSFLPGLGW